MGPAYQQEVSGVATSEEKSYCCSYQAPAYGFFCRRGFILSSLPVNIVLSV